jgi:spore coat protein U domain-containing protein, fimbrial subunit CupE1/2/3/6
MRNLATDLLRFIRQAVGPGLLGLTVLAAATQVHAQSCTVSMTNVAFGTVNVLPGTAVDTTATVTVTCSGGTGSGQRVCVSIGCGSACDSTSRKMTGPSSSTARYDLYSNSARTTLWGSWQTGYDTAGVQMNVNRNSSTNQTVYARFLASQQTDIAGSYTATLSAQPFITYTNQGGAANCPTGTLNASGSASVTATVSSNCTIGATAVSFGSQGILSSNKDAQGTLSVQCTTNLPYAVSLDGGISGASNPTQRKMTFSTSNVTYGLYRDAARSLPWGSTAGVDTASATGTGLTQTLTVYGRVPPQTTPKAGAYNDTIVATVTY